MLKTENRYSNAANLRTKGPDYLVKIACQLVLFALCIPTGVAASPVPNDELIAYWAKFRAAALCSDLAGSAALTRLPLEAGLEAD